jgi:hypothetical protein
MGPNTWKWEAGPSEPTDKGVKVLIIKEGLICIQENHIKVLQMYASDHVYRVLSLGNWYI